MSLPQVRLHVFSDYICPFCYLGSHRLLGLRDEFDLKVNWCHVEIHPEVPESGLAVAALGYSPGQWLAMNENLQRLAAEDGLTLVPPLRIAKSRKALLLAEVAKLHGSEVFYRLHQGLFHAGFVAGLDIGDEAVLSGLAHDAGLDPTALSAAWGGGEAAERLQHSLNLARQLHIRSTPTFVIGDRVLVGVQTAAALRGACNDTLRGRSGRHSAALH